MHTVLLYFEKIRIFCWQKERKPTIFLIFSYRCAWSTAAQSSTTRLTGSSCWCRFFHCYLCLLCFELCLLGDLQPADRHGSQVPRPKLDLPDWGEALVHKLLWLGSRWRRGWTKSKFPSATWRSSKRVFWWGQFQGSIPNKLLPAGVQGCPAVLLHGPREAGSIVGIPGASRVQTVWFLRQSTPHYVGVLLHGCAGEQYCWLNITSRRLKLLIYSPYFLKFMKLEKVEIGGIRGKALTSNIGKVYEEFKVICFQLCWQQKLTNTFTLFICKCCLFLGSL